MRIGVIALFMVACTLPACGEEALDPEVVGAHTAFVTALKAHDAAAVYDMAPGEVQRYFDKLFATLTRVVGEVRESYPAHERDAALEGLAADRLEGVTSGRELFGALLNLDGLPSGSGVDRGLQPVSIERSGDEAVVQTRAGEVFRYVLEAGERGGPGGTGSPPAKRWRAATIRAQLERYPSLKRLRLNLRNAHANLGTWTRATTQTTDVSKPEGAFNVVEQAVRRGARVMLFEQLDAGSRLHLAEGLKVVRELQTAAEKRFPSADARRAWLEERKLAWIERVADEKSLFAGLWDAGGLASELAFDGETTIRGTEPGASESESVVVVRIGEQERRLRFTRGMDGNYRLAELGDALLREGLRTFESELRAIPGGSGGP